MANIGLAKPLVAKLTDEAAKTYENGFYCGKAIQVSVVPNYSEGSLYGDDVLAEYNKEFRDGTISLNTTTLPIKSATVMFGHTISDDGEVVYKSGDDANYVGLGFVTKKIVDGATKFEGNVIYKAKFTEGESSNSTKGENIEYGTPTIEGTIAPIATGEWKKTKEFDTQEEAVAWYEGILCYTENYTVSFNSNGGSAVESQTVAKGGKVQKPDDPAKADNTFAGWYADEALETEWNFETGTVAGDMTLYAKWTED